MTADAALEMLRLGDPVGALEVLATAAFTDNADPTRHLARGMALLGTGQTELALSSLRTAIALGDCSPTTVLNLAIAEDRAGDADRARNLMQALAQRLPDWDEPVLRLAESLRAAGRTDEAEAAYHSVLELNPRRQEALVALGGLLIVRGAGLQASELLLRCCGIAPRR